MVTVVAVLFVDFPCHRFLAGGFDDRGDMPADVSGAIVNLPIRNPSVGDRMGQEIGAGVRRIKPFFGMPCLASRPSHQNADRNIVMTIADRNACGQWIHQAAFLENRFMAHALL